MPRGDGTGPTGQGPRTGRGMGGGAGTGGGADMGRPGGRGRMGGPTAAGPGGNCVCPNCKAVAPHQRGVPCYQQTCPKCGAKMGRQ